MKWKTREKKIGFSGVLARDVYIYTIHKCTGRHNASTWCEDVNATRKKKRTTHRDIEKVMAGDQQTLQSCYSSASSSISRCEKMMLNSINRIGFFFASSIFTHTILNWIKFHIEMFGWNLDDEDDAIVLLSCQSSVVSSQ